MIESILIQHIAKSEDMEDLETSLICARKIRGHLTRAINRSNLDLVKNLEALDNMIAGYQARLVKASITH